MPGDPVPDLLHPFSVPGDRVADLLHSFSVSGDRVPDLLHSFSVSGDRVPDLLHSFSVSGDRVPDEGQHEELRHGGGAGVHLGHLAAHGQSAAHLQRDARRRAVPGRHPVPGVRREPGAALREGRLLRRVDDLPVPRAHRHRVGGARAHLQQAQVPHGQPAADGRRQLRVPETPQPARGSAQAQDQHAAHRHRRRVRRQLDAAERLQHPRRFRPGALQADGQGRHGVRRVPPAGARVGVHQPRAVRLAERQLPARVRQHLLRVVRETDAPAAGRQRPASAGEHRRRAGHHDHCLQRAHHARDTG